MHQSIALCYTLWSNKKDTVNWNSSCINSNLQKACFHGDCAGDSDHTQGGEAWVLEQQRRGGGMMMSCCWRRRTGFGHGSQDAEVHELVWSQRWWSQCAGRGHSLTASPCPCRQKRKFFMWIKFTNSGSHLLKPSLFHWTICAKNKHPRNLVTKAVNVGWRHIFSSFGNVWVCINACL